MSVPFRPSRLLLAALIPLLAACGLLMPDPPPAPEPMPADVQPAALPELGAGQSAEALDATTEAERAAALAAPEGGERLLGNVVVALGSPAEQGFWLKTSLVSVAGKGRVALADGRSVAVDLIPADGAALLSLAAYRALSLGLTDLPELAVYIE